MKIARITKSKAAEKLKISRRTVIRYAQAGLISEKQGGKVLLSEVCKVWASLSTRGRRGVNRPKAFVPILAHGEETTGYALAAVETGQHGKADLIATWIESGVTSKAALNRKWHRYLVSLGRELQAPLRLQLPQPTSPTQAK